MSWADFITLTVGLLGLVAIGVGLWWINPAISLIVVGTILLLWSFFVSWMTARKQAMEARIKAQTGG